MTEKAEQIYTALRNAVATDQLILPTLPEVAIKIREAVEKDEHSAQEIAEILSQDASISARLLQLANSPLYRSRTEIDNLQMAITRLGTRIVRDLVITLAMRQIYQAPSDTLDKQFHELWETSVEVAAICRMLAVNQSAIEPEQALLAGLLHNVGALPLLQFAENDDELSDNADALKAVTEELQGRTGRLILEFWNFPAHLIDVVSQCHNLNRHSEEPCSYIDIVQVAILQSGHIQLPEDLSNVIAFNKLGLDSEINYIEIEENKARIEETKLSLISM